MPRSVTPLQLEILLHCYYSPQPWRGDRSLTPYKQAIQYFLESEMIEVSGKEYEEVYDITERGHAYIEAILGLPFPTKTWIVKKAS